MFKCGLRVSEVINLKISWIDWGENIIRVQKNLKPLLWSPKQSSERELPIVEDFALELKQFLGNRKSGYVFRSRKKSNNHRYNKESIIKKINELTKPIFGKTTGSHIFRKTYASHLLNEHIPVGEIKKYLGHSDIKTTFIYLESIPNRHTHERVRNIPIMKK